MTIFASPPVAHRAGDDATAPTDDRMNRNAVALIASSVVTSVLGFVFWLVAARTLSTADVGTGSALIAALVLLGNFSTLGLRNALGRFLPAAGVNSGSLIVRIYVTCVAAGALVGLVFIAGASVWAAELGPLLDGPLAKIAFIAAVPIWAVFVLQDNVLIGLRQATWVPVENLVYAMVKLGLLVALGVFGGWALLLAWTIPALLILGPLNAGIFKLLVPKQTHQQTPAERIDWRAIARFSGGDHLADMVRLLGAEGVVLVVLAHLGPTGSAPLFIAITIAASLQLVSSNIVSAMVAEMSARPHDAVSLVRRSLTHMVALIVPGAVIGAVLASSALSLFGSDYATEATTVLRILLLASIPHIVTTLAIGVARFERRVGFVVRITIGTSAGPLIGGALLAPRFGLVAVGWGVMISQIITAVVLLRTILRPYWTPTSASELTTKAIAVRDGFRRTRRNRAAATVFDELDATRGDRRSLHPRSIIETTNDVVVARVNDPFQPRIVKVALSRAASYGLHAHINALRDVGTMTQGTNASRLIPDILEVGSCFGQTYVIERACVGRSPVAADHSTLAAVAGAFGELHASSARPEQLGDDLAYEIIDGPIRTLLSDRRLSSHAMTIERLGGTLRRSLARRQLVVARTHGDCWLGNVLVDPDADTPIVTGIVDWENSIACGLPDVDLAHLWLSVQTDGIAEATVRALDADGFADLAGVCATDTLNGDLPAGLVMVLAWLAHVSAGIERSSRFSLGRIWLGETVIPVLTALEERDIWRAVDPLGERQGT